MGLGTNGTRSSQTEILNRNYPNFFVNGKRPWNLFFQMAQFIYASI